MSSSSAARSAAWLLLLPPALLAATGCGRHADRVPASAPVARHPQADTMSPVRSAPATPPAAVTLERLDRIRPARLEAPLPDAAPDSVIPESPARAGDPVLQPPVLLASAPLATPHGAHGRAIPGRVELEVEVGPSGRVMATRWAGGSPDSALVRAATACAHAMRFLPARRGDEAVAVWCLQRFDFGGPPSR